jgi:cobyrinic acid a,c-diamide synthase
MPTYAECGGLMYLARSVSYLGRTHRMVGAIPGDAVMHARPSGRGYVTLLETSDHPWGRGAGATIAAHEFHYSTLENLDPSARFAYRVARGEGLGGGRDGLVHRNVLASYAHLRSVGGNDWAARFVSFIQRHAAAAHAPRSLELQP